MPKMKPIPRRELLRKLKQLGFEGPFPGGKHDAMRRPGDQAKVPIPRDDAKSREIGVELQKRIMKEIGVSLKEWLAL
jgi:predicted RNA binding protein YcfA (HicA-like mRNA interferase family)